MHAYRQAPWRTRRQTIGLFLAVLVCASMVAALYLSVTSRTAIIGREIQSLESEISANRQRNADLETRLAILLSNRETERRAREQGFRPAGPDEIHYLVVPGYVPPQPVSLAARPDLRVNAPAVPPEYTQSLFEWFDEQMRASTSSSSPVGASQ